MISEQLTQGVLDTEHDVGETTRRGALGKLGKFSASALLGLMGAGALASEAEAFPYAWECCLLAYPCCANWCTGSGGTWSCPSGSHSTAWTCCYSGASWGCGECMKISGTNCSAGNSQSDYACSYGWHIGNTGC
jgi:hypothetical protein